MYDGLLYKKDSLLYFSIDDCQQIAPAAGYRNGSSSNNVGSNGNYWSSTPNEDNDNNAYNLNFNSGNHDWNNWNNRNNGQSVRPVSELTSTCHNMSSLAFSISKEQLLKDLLHAYKDARKHKQSRLYQLKFEYNLENNLVELRDELFNRTYKPYPSICFIIHDPKMREVFAANFRDRIVHHLFYNYTHKLFENKFVYDSYSCIKKRGIHFGISRLQHHILSVSDNYKKPCYILKIDIKGYFMHINRKVLYDICCRVLSKMVHHRGHDNKRWREIIDFKFVFYLLESIINTSPMDNCIVLGDRNEWNMLPREKSMLHADIDCGLPIGNLSSQLFSNVYMNEFDQYVKRTLKCKHYGRYVDDIYIVADSKEKLWAMVPSIQCFLKDKLHLEINRDKLCVLNAKCGVEFLGTFIKPFRTYIAKVTGKRLKEKLYGHEWRDLERMRSSVNSFLGALSHHNSYIIRRMWLGRDTVINKYGRFSPGWSKFVVNILDRKRLAYFLGMRLTTKPAMDKSQPHF